MALRSRASGRRLAVESNLAHREHSGFETEPNPDRAAAKRAFDAMMTMKKIDIAAIEAACRG
jgi:hypothetical protein